MPSSTSTKRRLTTRRFSPHRSRDELRSWAIEVFLNVYVEDAYRRQRLGDCGVPISDVAIEALLVGHFKEGNELVKRAETLLRLAIERDEQNGLDPGSIRQRHVLTDWIHYRKENKKLHKAVVHWYEDWLDAHSSSHRKLAVQQSLPTYLDAQEFDKLLNRFETEGLKVPANILRVRGQGTMACILAKQTLGIEYTQVAAAKALNAFLARCVPEWLSRGHFTTVARWMKIAHWQPGDDPVATILRCYDYLPGLKPPDYSPVVWKRPTL